MIVVVPATRRNELTGMASVIDEALRRRHTVLLQWAPDPKPGLSVTRRSLSYRWPEAEIVEWMQPLPERHVWAAPLAAWRPPRARPGRRIVSLDLGLNHLGLPADVPVDALTWTTVDMVELWQAHERRASRVRSFITGDPSLDRCLSRDPPAFPRPYLLVFSCKLTVPHAWRRRWYRGWPYLTTMLGLRRWCRRTGRALVIKTRLKHGDPWWLRSVADHVVHEEHDFTSASLHWLAGADAAVHWQSGAVYECVASGVRSISLRLPAPHLRAYDPEGWRFGLRVPRWSPQWWPGVVDSVNWRAPVAPWAAALGWPVDWMQLRQYRNHFLGPLDDRAGQRVVDVVEEVSS